VARGAPGGAMSGAAADLYVGPCTLETLYRGGGHDGRVFLLLHGSNPVSAAAPFLDGLAGLGEVWAPSHPGFGNSPRSEDFDTVYDLVQLYRGVLDALAAPRVVLVGFSFGGWLAAELAVGGHPKLDRLVLVDPVGIKLGGRLERDIAHLFNSDPGELNRRAWHDPARRPAGCRGVGWQAAVGEMSDAEIQSLARNWDALCLYAWRPHLYNPQLRHWLFRIAVPTLVLWGESDGIVTPGYGRRYAALIPGARFESVAEAGHHPELEQPEEFVTRVARFLGDGAREEGRAVLR
jgi:pimeloyl-ACP methyl ester carboxylesterase